MFFSSYILTKYIDLACFDALDIANDYEIAIKWLRIGLLICSFLGYVLT